MLNDLIDQALGFVHTYPLLGVLALLVFALYVWQKPKSAFKLGVTILIIVGILFALNTFRDPLNSGMQQKDEMIYKTRRQIDNGG